MTFTALEKKKIDEIRAELRGIEEDIKSCPWMLEKHKSFVIEGDPSDPTPTGLRWPRQHLKTKHRWPTIDMIHEHLFKGKGMDGMSITDMRIELKRTLPTHTMYMEQLHTQIYDLVCGSWGQLEPDRVGPVPRNFSLPDSHPDRCDVLSFPFFVATDPEGYAIIGFDKDDLSTEAGAINARKNYGTQGRHVDGRGEQVTRFPMPEIPDLHRELRDKRTERTLAQQRKAEAIDVDESGYIPDAKLKQWYEKVVLKTELKEKESILNRDKAQLKALVKSGEVSDEDYRAFNVKSQLNFFERELRNRYLNNEYLDELRRLEGRYRKWHAETHPSERNKTLL